VSSSNGPALGGRKFVLCFMRSPPQPANANASVNIAKTRIGVIPNRNIKAQSEANSNGLPH
jgi:hypothetical protein